MNHRISLIIGFIVALFPLSIYGQECVVEYVDPAGASFLAAGGEEIVSVFTYPYGCSTSSSSPAWIELDWWSEDLCSVICSQNSGTARSGYIYFGDVVFYVYQYAASAPLSAGTISGTATVCYGASAGTLSGTSASGGSCGSSYSYLWEVSSTSSTSGFSSISGATGLSYSAPTQTATRYYRRKVTCSTQSLYSNVLTVSVYAQLTGGEIEADQIILSGKVPSTLTSVSSGGGGNGTGSYQWYSSQNGGTNWGVITGATVDSCSPATALTISTLYRRKYTNSCGIAYSNNVQVTIGKRAYPDQGQNFIFTAEPLTEVADTASLFALPFDSLRQSITYFDGLGRANQIISVVAGPGFKDIITPIEYDPYGREATKYLPYVAENNFGQYSETAVASQGGYYAEVYPDETAYAKTIFESSPLNRVLKQGAPGTVWQPENNHVLSYDYNTNTQYEVLSWRVTNDSCFNTGTELSGGYYYYPAGTLYKSILKDENWTTGNLHTQVEYKDLMGKVVLKKSYVLVDTIVTPVETYYIYDDFNLLRYVLPPEATHIIESARPLTRGNDTVKMWCYYYEYDSRKRMIIKQLPGAEQVYMVYDNRDRLVGVQDGNMRDSIINGENTWLVTKYDELNRPVLTGRYSTIDTTTQKGMQGIINTFYSDSTNLYYTTRTNLWPIQGYDQNSFPEDTTNLKYYTVSYYDDYLFKGKKSFNSTEAISDYQDSIGNPIYQNSVKSMNTGSKTLVLDGGNTYLLSTTYYDEKYRPIQVLQDLYGDTTGGNEITSNRYGFIGQVLQSKVGQVFNSDTTTLNKYYTYDHVGRLLVTEQAIDGDSNGRVTLSEVSYDDLGQLKQKSFHVTASGPLQSNEFKYNIRGWLTDINNTDNLEDDLFALRLFYNTTGVSPLTTQAQYNGNISGLIWKSGQEAVDTLKRAYGFTYDELNRLVASDYGESENFTYHSDHFNESVGSYDLNGNIVSLTRAGVDNGVYDPEYDVLSYTYKGNQLYKVEDGGDTTKGFIDLQNFIDDYSYDSVGNLTKDLNKGITTIKYNYLNLPSEVIKDANNRIVYTYDAIGTKLRKAHYTGETPTYRYYAGAFEYSNVKALDLIHTDEGVVNYDDDEFTYEYFLKDHLGNTRATFSPNGTSYTLLQTYDFYPFGMRSVKTDRSSDNKYLYNGKELQDELGLEWYDYGARFYDPQIGRFVTADPLAEKMYNWSEYSYGFDRPICLIDLGGFVPGDPVKNPKIVDNRASNLMGVVRTPISGPNKGIMNTRTHQGFDYDAPIGTPALAVKYGTIVQVDNVDDSDYGLNVTLQTTNDDGSTSYSFYGHLSAISIDVGDVLNEGDVIGLTGVSGTSGKNPHLHFENRSYLNTSTGLAGHMSPNKIVDTKFNSQNPDQCVDQKTTGVQKVSSDDAGVTITNQNINGTNAVVRTPETLITTTDPATPRL